MSYQLARELYGGEPWMMHGKMFAAYSQVLIDSRIGKGIDIGADKLNTVSILELSSDGNKLQALRDRRNGAEEKSKSPVIAVTLINGPITKGGGASSTGMKEIAQELLTLDADPNVVGHILQVDSGGGSALGMQVLNHALLSLKKPKVGIVERAGMAASAAYGILSHTDYIMAEDFNSEVGSIGTMISFAGYPSGEKDANGAMHITAYATASTAKNKAFEEAINNKNTTLLVSEVLDPFNERFLAATRKQRPNIKETQLDGSMYNAGEVVGTMVDQIGNFQDAVNKVLELSNTSNNFSANKKPKSKNSAMTADEIKTNHPDAYGAIFAAGRSEGVEAGTSSEQERVKCWQQFSTVDPDAVNKGIESGKAISHSETIAFMRKESAGVHLTNLQKDSNKTVITPEAGGNDAVKTAEELAHEKEVNNIFGDYFKKN